MRQQVCFCLAIAELFGSNFSFLRLGGRPMRLPFLLFLGGCFSLYFFLFLAFRSCLFLNARSSRLSSVTFARLSFMRIASSPLVPKSCMTWNKSMTISACGNSFLTMLIMLSENGRPFDGGYQRALPAVAVLVGEEGEQIVLQCRLVNAQPFAHVLLQQHPFVGMLSLLPVLKAAQVLLVDAAQILASVRKKRPTHWAVTGKVSNHFF